MAVPSFHRLIPSVLRAFAGRHEASLDDFEQSAIEDFKLSLADQEALLPSGRQRVLRNRVGWAKWHLAREGYLEAVSRGRYRLTAKGLESTANADSVVAAVLQHRRLQSQQRAPELDAVDQAASQEVTPEEAIERAHQELRQDLAIELLDQVKKSTPRFFEQLVVKLMLKMGYGGSRAEAGKAIGGVGDGGIDGVINEDRLGLDAIYLQAKKWEGPVGRPEVQRFVGALAGQRANKGVFLTTSSFTQEAFNYAAMSQYKVVLIDGQRLADLMIELDLGVSLSASYQLKRVDTDFFADE